MLIRTLPIAAVPSRWSAEKALQWQGGQPWTFGCNFIPSTAINQLEMWQADTFDPATIDRELGWAQGIGMNSERVYLHDLAYEQDPAGFFKRVDQYLQIADKHHIRTLFVFFDDCWLPEPKIGKQPAPKTGVHNSGWLNSPGVPALNTLAAGDKATEQRLEKYVKAVLSRYAGDKRIMGWDLYNEPGNGEVPQQHAKQSNHLLELVFRWAREINPSQPLTSGVWSDVEPVRGTQISQSDVITFHVYANPEATLKYVQDLEQKVDRPLFLCTEFMSRGCRSTFQGCLPIFIKQKIGALCWGLVAGKTNTIFPWGSQEGAVEPKLWFHDVFHKDGVPFDSAEIDFLRQFTGIMLGQTGNGVLGGLRKLSGVPPLRDPSICLGADDTYYLTGTCEPFYGYNNGIRIWKSKDLAKWEPLGVVWCYGGSLWHAPYLEAKKSLWAPEIHYAKETFWLTYSLSNWGDPRKTQGAGLLKSATGKPEGPYEDVQPGAPLGDFIDGSLFEDDDGAMYFLWHCGKIARLKPDMSGLAEPYRLLKTSTPDPDPKHHAVHCAWVFDNNSFDHVGFEGAFLFKRNGIYYLCGADNFDGRYSCAIATSTNIYGPYSSRYEAIPNGGHNTVFQDAKGNWWSTYFGSPWYEHAAILPIRFSAEGKVEAGL